MAECLRFQVKDVEIVLLRLQGQIRDKHVKSTMICTHVLSCRPKAVHGPLDE